MKASDVLLPGSVWAHYDYDWNSSSSCEKIVRSTVTILEEVIDPDFTNFRVRAIEQHSNGVINHIIWSPPGDVEGLRVMGYKRVI